MSAGDVVQPLVAEIAKPVVKLIGQELNYLLRPTKYANKLDRLVKPLRETHQFLEAAVAEAEGLGKSIKPEVEQWLKSAGEVIAQAEELLKDSTTQRCFHGWCVDLGSRYKINKRAVEISMERIPALAPAPESTSVALPPHPPTVVSDPDFMEFESTKETMRQIMEALRDAECGIVGVYGMGGIGKTTIVKKIAEMVKQDKQFDQVAMAVVSQTVDVKKIQGAIASTLDLQFNQDAEVQGRATQLLERLKKLKSILVILDNVWEQLDLATIGIPDFARQKGCKVVLTTRNGDVCTSMGTGKHKIEVGVLSEIESWELFKRSAGNSIEASPKLNEVALDVMRECQYLPIALKTVGSALRDKSVEEWEAAKLQLSKAITTNIEGLTKEIISCLRLSYDYLQTPHTKACFLICCLFPADYNIPYEILVRYATGKGLFLYADTINGARTLVEETLRILKASSLLLEGDEAHCVKVHDVVRDVGLSIAFEAKLLSRSGPGLGRWLQRYSMEDIKGACFAFASEDAYSPVEGVQCPELEYLCLLATDFVSYSDVFFETMKKLKVLIHHGRSQMPTSLKCLVSLRALHLVKCDLVDMSTLGELKKLEALTINDTDIESMPVEVGQMTSLRLLDLLGNSSLSSIPGNVISRLTQLEELYIGDSFDDWEIEGTSSSTGDDVERGGRARLSELQSLPFLARLSVCVREFAQIPPNFCLPNKLVKFDIGVGRYNNKMCVLPTSRALKLRALEFQLEGVKSLLHLVDGNGDGSCDSSRYHFAAGVEEDGNGSNYVLTELAGGGGLNGLDTLDIGYIDWISALTSCDDKAVQPVPVLFGNLQELRLGYLGSLRELGSGGVLPTGSLQQLKVLEIERCGALEGWAVPWSWTHRLQLLEEVNIQDCNKITWVFEVKEEEEEENNTNASSSTLGPLSNLRKLRLYSLGSLRGLGSGGVLPRGSLQQLKLLEILFCGALEGWAVPWSWTHRLRHLETVAIRSCENVTGVFEVKEEEENNTNTSSTLRLLSNLREIELDALPRLRCLTNRVIHLSNLRLIHIDECGALEGWAVPWSWTHILRHLETVSISDCSNVIGVFEVKEEEENNTNTSSALRLLSNLRKIMLTGLPRLRCLTNGVVHLSNLRRVRINRCDRLVYVFARNVVSQSLVHLESLEISYCWDLEAIFEETTTSGDDKAVQPVLFGNLQELRLRGCHALKGLGSGALPAGSLQQLKVLEIIGCDALEGWAVPWSWTHRLRHLKTVSIGYCEKATGVFEVKEEEENNTNTSSALRLLSNLREIHLGTLTRLRCLTNGVIHLSNLRAVSINDCRSLVYVFARNVVSQSLVHLESLEISYCWDLEAIFEDTTTSIALPDLKAVSVVGCNQLKSLFTVSMAKGLLKLQELDLQHNSQLEEIVNSDENRASGAAAAEEKKRENNDNAQSSSSIISITWPQIRRIDLEDSRQLKRFCPENCCTEMPLLQEFTHTGFYSDWMQNFGADPPAHGLKIPASAYINIRKRVRLEEYEDSSVEEEDCSQ